MLHTLHRAIALRMHCQGGARVAVRSSAVPHSARFTNLPRKIDDCVMLPVQDATTRRHQLAHAAAEAHLAQVAKTRDLPQHERLPCWVTCYARTCDGL
jgi:hypothetical protein